MITDGLYFLCVDEIYTPNINSLLRLKREEIARHTNHLHFGLGGVVIPSSIMPELNMTLRKLQKRYYSKKKNPIFHYIDILHNRNLFSDLAIDAKKRKSIIDSLKYWISQVGFRFVAAFVDNHELIKQYGTFDKDGRLVNIKKIRGNIYPKSPALDYNLYSLALKFLLKNFYDYLSSKKYAARGIVVAESRGDMEDARLRDVFYQYQCSSIGSIKSHEFRQTIIDVFIIDKNQNHAGLQLADLLLYPTYDAVIPHHSVRTDHLWEYNALIKRKVQGESGITLFPQITKSSH